VTAYKLLCALIILIVTLLSGFYPFFKKKKSKAAFQLPIGEALACGVFLGAGLMHMLADASTTFNQLHIHYPYAFLLAGLTFLLLLYMEHIGKEIHSHQGASSNAFAILSVIMLSIHSFLAGAALGLTSSLAVTTIILLAIVAHKWAASFSLAIQITKSELSFNYGIALFFAFALMAPVGVLFGSEVSHVFADNTLIEPIFSSLAAGTFLYMGSLHGLERAVLVEQCCNLRLFYFVIIGFSIMSLVAVWT